MVGWCLIKCVQGGLKLGDRINIQRHSAESPVVLLRLLIDFSQRWWQQHRDTQSRSASWRKSPNRSPGAMTWPFKPHMQDKTRTILRDGFM